MHAVLRVDLKTRAIGFFHDFINPSRAVALRRLCVLGQVVPNWHIRILQGQMTGLVFFVIGVRQKDRRQFVKGQHAIRFGIVDWLASGCGFQRRIIWRRVGQRPRLIAGKKLVGKGIARAAQNAELMQGGAHIARSMQLVVKPRVLESSLERSGFGMSMTFR